MVAPRKGRPAGEIEDVLEVDETDDGTGERTH
jgi:hypothetical protein